MEISTTLLVLNDIWTDVINYENLYAISPDGIVKGLQRTIVRSDGQVCSYPEKILKSRVSRGGYETVRLNKNNLSFTAYVHRLVAAAYVSNPEFKPFVNHKNGVKTDNSFENLEWVTHQENVQHAYDNGLNSTIGGTHPNAVKVKNVCTGEFWNTINDAAYAMGVAPNILRYKLSRNSLKCFRKIKYPHLKDSWPINLN